MKADQFRKNINHIIIIHYENWNFDGLYGRFPSCNNLDSAVTFMQVDKLGNKFDSLPYPLFSIGNVILPDTKLQSHLQAKPCDLS